MREHVRQPTIGLRRLIETAANQAHALVAQPRPHLVMTHAAQLAYPLAGCRILDETAARFGARQDPAGAVYGRVQACGRRGAFHTGEDDGIIALGAADEAALAGKSGRRALAHDP